MKKLKLYGKVLEKHQKLESALWFLSFILLFPFAIIQFLAILFEKIAEFGTTLRDKMVYGLLRIILKKELQEFKEKYDNKEN